MALAMAVIACSEHEPAGPGSGDHKPPALATVIGWDVNHVVAVFDERVIRQTAENPRNYHINPYTPPGEPKTTNPLVVGSSDVVAAALHEDNRTVTLTTGNLQDAMLALNVIGVSDESGNILIRPSIHPFEATDQMDTTPPVVVCRSPAVGATGVSTDGFVTVAFSEAVEFYTLVSGLNVMGDGARIISIGSVDPLHYTCDLEVLNSNTRYYVSLAGIRDLAGNLMSEVQWLFETGSAYDVTQATGRQRLREAMDDPVRD